VYETGTELSANPYLVCMLLLLLLLLLLQP
jgi:hypothetical protein